MRWVGDILRLVGFGEVVVKVGWVRWLRWVG